LNDGARYGGLGDNAGVLLRDAMTGPVVYLSTLPIRAMVKAMRASGVPADISDAPGTFCCNHSMYGILHRIATEELDMRAGWTHLPHLPEVAAKYQNLNAPSMSAETSAAGVRAGLRRDCGASRGYR